MLDIAIIGAGGTGCAAARFAARAGHSVTVWERFTVDHDQGSSFGGSRIVRRTYPDALYMGLMGQAYPLWAALEKEAGETLLVRCGGLTFGSADNPVMAETEESLRVNGVAFERWTAAQVGERFPALRLGEGQSGIFQEDTGYLRASACVRAQMRLAQAAGAVLRENVVVEGIEPGKGGRVRVKTGDGAWEFDKVLVTAGAWMADLLPLLGLPLTVTRQYYAHLRAARVEEFAVGAFPVWIDADANFYGFPDDGETPGVKVAWHEHGQPTHPDRVARTVTDDDREPLTAYAAQHLPGLSGPPLWEKTCLYTNAPDEDFVLDAVPDVPGAFLCSGCSGHGFKFTILLGQILCRLAWGEAVGADVSRFGLARFNGGAVA